MGVIQADENGMVRVGGVMKNIWEMPLHEIAHDLGLMNFIYYMLIKTGFLPPVIFMGCLLYTSRCVYETGKILFIVTFYI